MKFQIGSKVKNVETGEIFRVCQFDASQNRYQLSDSDGKSSVAYENSLESHMEYGRRVKFDNSLSHEWLRKMADAEDRYKGISVLPVERMIERVTA